MEEGIASIIKLLSDGVDTSACNFWPPLTYELKQGHIIEVIRKLIERGANVNAFDASGLTPLLHALQKKCSSDVINELIRHGANVNVRDRYRPALMYALDVSEEISLQLIDSGADVNACDISGKTCTMYALHKHASENFLNKLLDNGAIIKDAFLGGSSFLIFALRYRYSTNIVSRIIEGGADVNAQDSNGRTPLMFALENSFDNDVLVKLINCGSDVNKYDNERKTCLMYAVKETWNDNLEKMLKCGASVNVCDIRGKSVLIYAIERSNCVEYITKLTNYGCNINVQDKSGWSSLMYALKQKSSNEIIMKLLDSGADVNLFDVTGKNSLMHSLINYNNKKIVMKLIECTADINSPDNAGFSPLMYALLHKQDLDVVNELLNRGSDVNYVNRGKSSLMWAVENHNDISVVNALLKHRFHLDVCDTDGDFTYKIIKKGADTNVADYEGKNLLMYSLLYAQDQRDFVLNLIDYVEDLNKKDVNGRTCLMYAINANADKDIIVKIIKNGGSVNARDIKGETVLMHAVRYCENKEVIQFLISAGANVNCVDNEGNNVLHHINVSDSELIQFFCKVVSINVENNKMQTPLMMAVLRDNVKLVKNFLSLGCNPNCLDCDFNNPLHTARSGDVVNLLVYYGTNLFAKNIFGKNPFQVFLENDFGNFFVEDIEPLIFFPSIRNRASYFLKNLLLFDENLVNDYLNCYTSRGFSTLWFYIKSCKRELIQLKENYISSDFTFHEFCNLKRTNRCKFINICETDYLLGYDKIKKLFPFFCDIILIKIKDNKVQKSKHDLFLNLDRIVMKPLVNISDDMLNFDCLLKICQYLDYQQLYNLFLASFL